MHTHHASLRALLAGHLSARWLLAIPMLGIVALAMATLAWIGMGAPAAYDPSHWMHPVLLIGLAVAGAIQGLTCAFVFFHLNGVLFHLGYAVGDGWRALRGKAPRRRVLRRIARHSRDTLRTPWAAFVEGARLGTIDTAYYIGALHRVALREVRASQAETLSAPSPAAREEREVTGRHWNFRVMEFEHDGEMVRAIHEVYYANDGTPVLYSAQPAGLQWSLDDDGGPQQILDRLREALAKPVLTVGDFPEGSASA